MAALFPQPSFAQGALCRPRWTTSGRKEWKVEEKVAVNKHESLHLIVQQSSQEVTVLKTKHTSGAGVQHHQLRGSGCSERICAVSGGSRNGDH